VDSSVIITCVSFAEPHQDKHSFSITCYLNNETEWEFCNGYAIDREEEADEASAQTGPLACEYEGWWTGEAIGTPARVLTMSKP
jgi:hypothetical protein